MNNDYIISNGAEDFDPESLLEDISNTVTKTEENSIYSETKSEQEITTDTTELSKNTGYSIVSIIVDISGIGQIEIAGILNNLMANFNSNFLHIEMNSLANIVIETFSNYVLSNVDNKFNTQLLSLKTNIAGKETVMDFNKYNFFLKSFICKEFQGKTVLCKLVFVRTDYLPISKDNPNE